MAAITVTRVNGLAGRDGRKLTKFYGTSTANQADTLTSTACEAHCKQRILYVSCTYSGAPTQAGVTVTLDSVLGAGYDALLSTGSANILSTVYVPDAEIWLGVGDAILVTAPAGGGSLTSAIVIAVDEV